MPRTRGSANCSVILWGGRERGAEGRGEAEMIEKQAKGPSLGFVSLPFSSPGFTLKPPSLWEAPPLAPDCGHATLRLVVVSSAWEPSLSFIYLKIIFIFEIEIQLTQNTLYWFQVYNIKHNNLTYVYIAKSLPQYIQLTSITTIVTIFFPHDENFKIYCLSNVQIYNMILLTTSGWCMYSCTLKGK